MEKTVLKASIKKIDKERMRDRTSSYAINKAIDNDYAFLNGKYNYYSRNGKMLTLNRDQLYEALSKKNK